jgi:quinol-cytochrome oxidoreductase complex cytochrome b subunit
MVLSILIFLLLPFLEWKTLVRSMWLLSSFERFSFYFFLLTILGLWWVGSLPAVEPYITFGRIFTFFYFTYFALVYFNVYYNNFIFRTYYTFVGKFGTKQNHN